MKKLIDSKTQEVVQNQLDAGKGLTEVFGNPIQAHQIDGTVSFSLIPEKGRDPHDR